MHARHDITGQSFGNYRAVSLAFSKPKGNGGPENYWNCVCVTCGIERTISRGGLNQFARDSSVCKHWKDNLVGQTFTRLTVIKKLGRGNYGTRLWECICTCGKTHTTNTSNLLGNMVKSCGCWWDDIKYDQRGVKRPQTSLGEGIASRNKLFAHYKRNARNRGYAFDLTLDQCIVLFQGNCHYCGCVPHQAFANRTCVGDYIYNGIDRVDNAIGYQVDNVVSACGFCNIAKMKYTYEEFILWIHRASAHLHKTQV